MPAIRCPLCGQRILHPSVTTACMNCGASLVALPQKQSASLTAATPSRPLVLPSPGEAAALQCPACNSPVSSTETACPDCGFSLEAPRSLALRNTSPQLPAISPRQPMTLQPQLDPFTGAAQNIMIGNNQLGPVMPTLPLWVKGKLPRGFPKRPPDAEGIIIHVQAQDEVPQPSLPISILKMFVNMAWAVPGDARQHEREKVHVTTVRVQTAGGAQKDARVEGYLKGANLSLGDMVSLWGWKRKGSLVVSRGYNHTAQASIVSSTMTSPLSGALILALALAGFLVLALMYHIPILPHWP